MVQYIVYSAFTSLVRVIYGCVYTNCVISYQFVEEHNREKEKHIEIKSNQNQKLNKSKMQAIKTPVQAID